MTDDSKQNNSPNQQPTPKKFSLENLANSSKILANVVSIVFHCWRMFFDYFFQKKIKSYPQQKGF